MPFSPEWDKAYRDKLQMSIWPWSDLVSYVYRYAKPANGFNRVLELGPGAGANISFFSKLGMDYHGIEGSVAIVEKLHAQYPELSRNIVAGDFTRDIPFAGPFDLVVDRGSLTHNMTAEIKMVLEMIFDRLRPGGKFIGIDWFSTAHENSADGRALDSHTRTECPSGQFAGLGAVHFSDQDHLSGLLTDSGFEVERLEHKVNQIVVPKPQRLGWWNFVATKP